MTDRNSFIQVVRGLIEEVTCEVNITEKKELAMKNLRAERTRARTYPINENEFSFSRSA